jgi:hypothetical protein
VQVGAAHFKFSYHRVIILNSPNRVPALRVFPPQNTSARPTQLIIILYLIDLLFYHFTL